MYSVYWPKWQDIAGEHVGNTQKAQYSSTMMRDTIRGRPACLAPSSMFASGSACSQNILQPTEIGSDRRSATIWQWSILFQRNIRDTLFFIWRSVHWRSHIYKAFFFRLCCGLFVFWLVESSHLQRHKLKDPMVIGRRLFSGTFLSLCLACT